MSTQLQESNQNKFVSTVRIFTGNTSPYEILDENKFTAIPLSHLETWELHFALDIQILNDPQNADLKKNISSNIRKALQKHLSGEPPIAAQFLFIDDIHLWEKTEYFGKGIRLFFQDSNQIKLTAEEIKNKVLDIWHSLQEAQIPLVTITVPGSRNIPGPLVFPSPLAITCSNKTDPSQNNSFYKEFKPSDHHPLLDIKFKATDLETKKINWNASEARQRAKVYVANHVLNTQEELLALAEQINNEEAQSSNLNVTEIENYFSQHFKQPQHTREMGVCSPSIIDPRSLTLNAEKYFGKHHQDYISLIKKNPEKMHSFFKEAFKCARIENENLALTFKMVNIQTDIDNSMSTLIEKAINGITAYKTRGKRSFWDSHLGFFQYIFRKNQGQMRANNYLTELRKETSSPLDKIKMVYTLLSSGKGPTLKYDVACNLLGEQTVENKTTDQIIIEAITLVEEYFLFHILSDKSTYHAALEEISLLEKQANTFKPEPAPAQKIAKELPAPGYWR